MMAPGGALNTRCNTHIEETVSKKRARPDTEAFNQQNTNVLLHVLACGDTPFLWR